MDRPARTFKPIHIALLTVSDTRGPDEDTSGDILAQRIRAGHALSARARTRRGRPHRHATQQLDRRSGH
jgi:molybdopterin biosynthesis enzyme MoaB